MDFEPKGGELSLRGLKLEDQHTSLVNRNTVSPFEESPPSSHLYQVLNIVRKVIKK